VKVKVSEVINDLKSKYEQITAIMNDEKSSEVQKEERVELIMKEIVTKINEYIQRKKYVHTF